jgi:translin
MLNRTFFEELQKELEVKIFAREKAISGFRAVITLSKQAIMALHRDESQTAKEKLTSATTNLQRSNDILSTHTDLVLGIRAAAYQEYAEAQVLWWIIEAEVFPEPNQLNIPAMPFLLGLADAIGEFRRRSLESLRRGDLPSAENCLQTMDDIYSNLISLENAFILAPELRRKCDVARRLIELTLGDVATAAGRRSLERSINQLEKRISE